MNWYPVYLLLFLLCSGVVQHFVPVFAGLHDARILVLPMFFLCAALSCRVAWMLVLAFVGGFLWDAQHVILPLEGDELVYTETVDEMRFGYSIILFGLMGYLMQGVRTLFQRRNWQLATLVVGVTLFLYLLVEFLAISFVRGAWALNVGVLTQIGWTSFLSMTFVPFLLLGLGSLARVCRYQIRRENVKKVRPLQRGD